MGFKRRQLRSPVHFSRSFFQPRESAIPPALGLVTAGVRDPLVDLVADRAPSVVDPVLDRVADPVTYATTAPAFR
jgi:hypothetical protein